MTELPEIHILAESYQKVSMECLLNILIMYLLAVNPSNSSFIYLCRLYFTAYLLSKFELGVLAMHLWCHLEKVTSYRPLWAWFKIPSAWSQRHEFAKFKLLVKLLKRSIFRAFFSLGAVILVTLPWSALRSFNQWQSRSQRGCSDKPPILIISTFHFNRVSTNPS